MSLVAWSVCLSVLVTWMFCAQTAELIEIPFWGLTLVGPRNHVLGGQDWTDPFAAARLESRKCGLLPNYFGLLLFINVYPLFTLCSDTVYVCMVILSVTSERVRPRVRPGYPLPPLLLPCPFTSSFFALYYFFPFSFSHSLYLFSSIVHPIPCCQNRPTPFPGKRS